MTLTTEIDDATVLELVRAAVSTVLELPVETLDAKTSLVEDAGADSLAMIEIVEIVEEELRARGRDLRIDDESLARLQTLGDIVQTLDTMFAAGRTEPSS